ncbi:MAG: hypothetical protein EBR09_00195 [Proteobacteria bacterium]|nr:hypothetical protein [Pseudomonadota bacterium]
MPDFFLSQKLKKLCESPCTLLWLEGSKHDRVLSVRLQDRRLILKLSDQTSRVVAFDKYSVTSVGLQFWSNGRPGVLYRWEQVPRELTDGKQSTALRITDNKDDPPPSAA